MTLLALALGPAIAGTPTDPVLVGDVKVTALYHGTVVIQHGNQVVWIDPWSKADLTALPKANLVVITDVHPDHLDAAAVAAVSTPTTQIIAPPAVAKADGAPTIDVQLANGQRHTEGAWSFEAVPMYNLSRGPEAGTLFHDKGRGNGYIVTVAGQRIYVAGDTACTPEMKALTGIDLALVPMNLPYTMPPEEAAACVAAFKPGKVTPIHYAGSDLSVFEKGLAGVEGVTVVLRDAYPGGLPW